MSCLRRVLWEGVNLILTYPVAVYLWSKIRVIVFYAASWNVCLVYVGDDGIEVSYCDDLLHLVF